MTDLPIPRRTYLFALVDGGGTVPPELGTARRLVARGHHVVVLAEDSMMTDVEASGATFRRRVDPKGRRIWHPRGGAREHPDTDTGGAVERGRRCRTSSS